MAPVQGNGGRRGPAELLLQFLITVFLTGILAPFSSKTLLLPVSAITLPAVYCYVQVRRSNAATIAFDRRALLLATSIASLGTLGALRIRPTAPAFGLLVVVLLAAARAYFAVFRRHLRREFTSAWETMARPLTVGVFTLSLLTATAVGAGASQLPLPGEPALHSLPFLPHPDGPRNTGRPVGQNSTGSTKSGSNDHKPAESVDPGSDSEGKASVEETTTTTSTPEVVCGTDAVSTLLGTELSGYIFDQFERAVGELAKGGHTCPVVGSQVESFGQQLFGIEVVQKGDVYLVVGNSAGEVAYIGPPFKEAVEKILANSNAIRVRYPVNHHGSDLIVVDLPDGGCSAVYRYRSDSSLPVLTLDPLLAPTVLTLAVAHGQVPHIEERAPAPSQELEVSFSGSGESDSYRLAVTDGQVTISGRDAGNYQVATVCPSHIDLQRGAP